jgi:hypothetical protein
MSQNIGTLISSSIRPNNSLDPIASAFGNEIKGGHHAYASLSERNSIIPERREWGMLVTVYNDGINNGTYQLSYNYVDTLITNNSNWTIFNTSSSTNTEWLNSVFKVLSVNPTSPSIGDRYLISNSPTGIWGSHPNKVVEWIGSGTWSYIIPSDGTSVRVDEEDSSVYKYEGSYPSGVWVKEMVSQVRFIVANSINGITYSAFPNPTFSLYQTEMVYLTTFGITNSASASLNINGLGYIPIKKLSGIGLVDVSTSDLLPSIVYNMSYDGSNFQISIPVGATSVGVIGPAEDGSYSDGLFTDFNPSTPIGTPIDRFNEILKSLVPPSAPDLSDWSGAKSGSVNGRLSFDNTYPIIGYVSATNSPTIPTSVDGYWTASGKRIGIAASASSDIIGILNYQVATNSNLPTPSYISTSFGDANVGILNMYVNGILINSASMSLSNLSSQDTTVGGSLTGFSISAATSSKFPQGDIFNNFWNRTGVWRLKGNDANIVLGYNYIHVTHDNSPSFMRTLVRHEFIIDNNTTSTSITSATISSYLLTGSKILSGIKYFTGGSIRYDVTIDNLYRNTYYSDSDAISFTDQSGGITSPILITSDTLSLAPSNGNESKQFKISNIDQNGSSLTFSIVNTNKRRINESIGLNITAKRTVQGSITGGLSILNNVYMDNFPPSSTDFIENFDDESYRLINTFGGFQYDLYSLIGLNPWDSSYSIISATSGYDNGLQVYNGTLVRPMVNFSNIGTLSTNLNFGYTMSNYSSATSSRVYIRYFRQLLPTTGNFVMTINGSGGNFVGLTTSLIGNNIHVEIKAPGASSSETGWMDAYSDFATGLWSNGSGARNASSGVGRSFGTTWGLTIGTKNTANTNGYMIIRITVGSTFTGNFDSINWNFA